MHEVKRYNPIDGTQRSIHISHTKEEYFAWINSACGGNLISLGANLSLYLPKTTPDERSFLMTGMFLNEKNPAETMNSRFSRCS